MNQEPELQESVVSMAQYLRDTLAELDGSIRDMQAQRHRLAVRLAVIEAAEDPAVKRAVEEYSTRSGEPYPDAESAGTLISDAHRHFIKP